MATPTLTNVLVGYAKMWTGPKDTVRPPDTLAEGADWASPWTYIGGTEEGVALLSSSEQTEIRIEEQDTAVRLVPNQRNTRVRAVLSEATLENLKLALGGGAITTVAAASGQPGMKVYTFSDALDELAVGFEGVNPLGFFRRLYIPSVISVADLETRWRRAANNQSFPFEARAVCSSSQIAIRDKTAAALA